MKTDKTMEKAPYSSPEVEMYEVNLSKVICLSGNLDDYTNEEFNW